MNYNYVWFLLTSVFFIEIDDIEGEPKRVNFSHFSAIRMKKHLRSITGEEIKAGAYPCCTSTSQRPQLNFLPRKILMLHLKYESNANAINLATYATFGQVFFIFFGEVVFVGQHSLDQWKQSNIKH